VTDAREALRRQHESDLAQNNHLVSELTDRLEMGEDIAEFFELPAEYEQLTAAVIQEAAKRYLDTNNYVRVTLFPEKTGQEQAARHLGRASSRLRPSGALAGQVLPGVLEPVSVPAMR
jgi:predicted Zn-dependent peptidase